MSDLVGGHVELMFSPMDSPCLTCNPAGCAAWPSQGARAGALMQELPTVARQGCPDNEAGLPVRRSRPGGYAAPGGGASEQ